MSDETKNNLPVETEDMVDTASDAVADVLSDPTIPPPIKKGFTAACKRLGTAMVEGVAGYFERRSTEKWAETDARVKIIEETGDQIRQRIKVDPEFPQRASYTFAKQILREQFNREQVLGTTADILKEKKYNNSENQQADSEPEKPISEDWFNIFDKEASQKSSEDMQLRFAKVLAGEIEKPGSHSIKAIKALGDMDQTTADLFQKLCSASVCLEYTPANRVIDIRVLSLDGDPRQNSLSEYGLSYRDLNILDEYGLIIAEYNSWIQYQGAIVPRNNVVPTPFRYQGQYWALKPFPERPESDEYKLYGVKLSKVGRELFHIPEQIRMTQYTQDLKEFFAKQQLEMVEVLI